MVLNDLWLALLFKVRLSGPTDPPIEIGYLNRRGSSLPSITELKNGKLPSHQFYK